VDGLALGVAAAALAEAVALSDGAVLAAGGVVDAVGGEDACAMTLGAGAVACGEVTLQLASTAASKKVKIVSGRFRVGNIKILCNGRYCAVQH